MSRKAVFILFLVVVLGLLLVALPFSWFRAPKKIVKANGHPVLAARVYQNAFGDVLIDLQDPSESVFMVRKKPAQVGIPDDPFPYKSTFMFVSRSAAVKLLPLDLHKIEPIDPHLMIEPHEITFVSDATTILQVMDLR